ncbi:MAG: class I SAM-dependent methyltransferase [Acetobacteraceae bacterium]|nr:class I SAM-dependent methyltransferase [Acetobacteraceae bacterium]
MLKRFLHAGCGAVRQGPVTTPGFLLPAWEEVRLDIDPSVGPDILASLADIPKAVEDGSFDAAYTSHALEHLFFHEVPLALAGLRRVLRSAGYLVVSCPDIRAVAAEVAAGRLLSPVAESASGPLTPMDMLFGWGAALAGGNHYMAHRCGLDMANLARLLMEAGFATVLGGHPRGPFTLWAVASVSARDQRAMRGLAQRHFPLDEQARNG